MAGREKESKGRILTIEHPTESTPALTVFSGNAGQLLRGDLPTLQVLKAMRQRAHRNGVAFVMHIQEAGAGRKTSVGMTRLLEEVFGDEVAIFRYGHEESNGQIRQGLDQYLVSSTQLTLRARSIALLPMVERNILRRNQRAAIITSFDFVLPGGELAYLLTTGFHYDLGLTPISKHVSRLQALETRRCIEQLIEQDSERPSSQQKTGTSIRGHKGFMTFSGDGNTHGFIGTRWQLDRIEALKNGLGGEVKEATEEIRVTANLPQSIQQEFLGKKHPVLKFAGNLIDDVIEVIDETTGSTWGERKLDHQFYRDFTITPAGTLVPLDRFDVIENTVFYDFENADHYFISTLFGYHMSGEEE
jgi:hypothetical protein